MILDISENINQLPFRSQCDLDNIIHGLNYDMWMLKRIVEYNPNYKIIKNEESTVITNSFLESALYHIRKFYEFFFSAEHYHNNKIGKMIDHFRKYPDSDDIIAEFYFNNPDDWL